MRLQFAQRHDTLRSLYSLWNSNSNNNNKNKTPHTHYPCKSLSKPCHMLPGGCYNRYGLRLIYIRSSYKRILFVFLLWLVLFLSVRFSSVWAATTYDWNNCWRYLCEEAFCLSLNRLSQQEIKVMPKQMRLQQQHQMLCHIFNRLLEVAVV